MADPDRYWPASLGKSGPVSADTQIQCESAMGSEGLSAKVSADPSKTAPSTDDTSSMRGTPPKVRVEGVRVDVEGFVYSRGCNYESALKW